MSVSVGTFVSCEGPQTVAVQSTSPMVCLTGGRGGGRTTALIMRPIVALMVNNPRFRGILVGAETGDENSLFERAADLYREFGADKVVSKQELRFQSGARMHFCNAGSRDAIEPYLSGNYQFMGVDDIDRLSAENVEGTTPNRNFMKLLGSLRSAEPSLPPQLMVVATPGGHGHKWVQSMFIEDSPVMPNRELIRFSLGDNPYLEKNGRYRSLLMAQDRQTQKHWIDGSWE